MNAIDKVKFLVSYHLKYGGEMLDTSTTIKCLDQLLQQETPIEENPLYQAAYNGNKDIVEYLMQSGGDIKNEAKSRIRLTFF